MRRKAHFILLFLFALVAQPGQPLVNAVSNRNFWDKPFTEWTREQVLEMLEDSPWAKTASLKPASSRSETGQEGETEFFYKIIVRFFSATPIREAYVRRFQIMRRYDMMPPGRRQELDAHVHRALDLDVSDRVILAVDFLSNDPDATRKMGEFLETSTTQTMRRSARLITGKQRRIELTDYYAPSPDGTGAKFIFPRYVKAQPVIEPGEKEVRFEFDIPVFDQTGSVSFKAAQMLFQGQLSY